MSHNTITEVTPAGSVIGRNPLVCGRFHRRDKNPLIDRDDIYQLDAGTVADTVFNAPTATDSRVVPVSHFSISPEEFREELTTRGSR